MKNTNAKTVGGRLREASGVLALAVMALGAPMFLLATAPARADDAAPAAAAAAPDALIRNMSTDVLDAIRKDKDLQAGDIGKLQALVDQRVLPHVDFRRMTQLAVARGWRAATPEQRDTLIKEFRTLLLHTYSGAMSQVRDQQVELRPFRSAPADTEVVVRSQIVGGKGDPVQLDYRLEKTDAGWKIFDVNVLGVWLVETYKTQFSEEVNKGGIDGLIASLQQRNRSGTPAAK